jgi:hypothetical protein
VMWVIWNIVSIRLETVLASVQDRCSVCIKRSIGSEITLDAPVVLLGDEVQVEARFGPFGDSANPNARWVDGLSQTNHRLRSCVGRTHWNS